MKHALKTAHAQAISSVYGRITQLFLVAGQSPIDRKTRTLAKRYEQLFSVFGDRVSFVILADLVGGETGDKVQMQDQVTEDYASAMVEAHLNPGKSHVIFLHSPKQSRLMDGAPRKEWARDAFLVGNAGPYPVIIEPYLCQFEGYRSIAEQIASLSGILIQPTWLTMEGGNVLVGDDYALVGKDLLLRNIVDHLGGLAENTGLNDSENQAKIHRITAEFKTVLGVDHVIWVGEDDPIELGPCGNLQKDERLQPLFHIDLFVTLCGLTSDGREKVLVADLTVDEAYLSGSWEKYRDELNALNSALDRIAAQLRDSHTRYNGPEFEVITIPIGFHVEEDGRLIPYSFNNALVEWYHGVRRITFPEYNHEPKWVEMLDKIKHQCSREFDKIRSLDFNFDILAASHGSLHCLTQVLNRTER